MVPKISTVNETISQRGDRVYIDAGQNDYADTLAAPYSIRAYHRPLVSAPLTWREVKPGLDRYAFDMTSIIERVKAKGDLFAGVLDRKIAVANSKRLKGLTEEP